MAVYSQQCLNYSDIVGVTLLDGSHLTCIPDPLLPQLNSLQQLAGLTHQYAARTVVDVSVGAFVLVGRGD